MISYRIEIGGDDTGRTDMQIRFDSELRRDNIDVDYIVNIARELNSALTKLHELNTFPHSDNQGKTNETV